jgi:hypothetical protein
LLQRWVLVRFESATGEEKIFVSLVVFVEFLRRIVGRHMVYLKAFLNALLLEDGAGEERLIV